MKTISQKEFNWLYDRAIRARKSQDARTQDALYFYNLAFSL